VLIVGVGFFSKFLLTNQIEKLIAKNLSKALGRFMCLNA